MPDVITYERRTRRLSIDADKATTLNEAARTLLRTALVVAAEKFDANAKEFRDALPAMQPLQRPGYESLAKQFESQATGTRSIIDLIDGADDAEADTAIIFVAEGG